MTATIDPRIQARRVAVARASGRRRLYRILAVAAVLAVGGLAYSLSQSRLLDIDEVRLESTGTRVDAELVADALRIDPRTPMVEADLARYERTLEALPWVDEADVRRDWPNALVVELTERTPVAATLAGPDLWVIVDHEGRVLDYVDTPPSDLLAITGVHTAGPPGSVLGEDAAPLLELTDLLEPGLVAQLRGAWREGDQYLLGMRSGERIVLGTADDLPRKLAAATAVLERIAGRTGWELDVAVPSAPVLRGGG